MQDNEQETRTIFVGNLSEKVTDEILYELFLQAGPIERVSIPKDRNFGFVTYSHEISVSYAIQLFLGTRLFGKEVALKNRNNNSRDNSRDSSRDNPRDFQRLSSGSNSGNQSRDSRGSYSNSPVPNSNGVLRFGMIGSSSSTNMMPNFSPASAPQSSPMITQEMLLRMGSHLKINPYAQQSSSPLSHNQGRNDNIHRHQKYDRRDKPYERRRSRSPDRRNNRNGGGRDRDQDNYNQERRGRY